MDFEPDTSYLENITGGDKSLIKEMIDILKEQLPEFVNDMKDSINTGNYTKFASVLHKAKSSVAIIGLNQLTQEIKAMEECAAEGYHSENYLVFIEHFSKVCNNAVIKLEEIFK